MKLNFIFLCLFFNFSASIENNFDESLDTILHDHAFRVMIHSKPHTGALYDASLPSNLAGMKVSVVGLRSKTLWKKGANFSDFIIPPKTLPVPYVKRLLIVYHNFGNWSMLYFNLSGFKLMSPVVGFLVYDATSSHLSNKNLSRIELNTMGSPISIQFQNSTLDNQRTKCATFGAFGEVFLSEMRQPNICYSSRSQGHFSIVVPFEKKQKIRIWIMGFLVGLVGLILVVLVGVLVVKSFLGKRSREIENDVDEEEVLQTYWLNSSKMPRAEVTRTQPALESTTLPNPKQVSWYA